MTLLHYFLARVLAKALKMLFCVCNLFSQIFRFFHIFNFWWNNHWNISSDFQLYLFFDQIESDLSKMNQNGSNWISDVIIIEIYHKIFIFFSIFWSDWIRSVQNCHVNIIEIVKFAIFINFISFSFLMPSPSAFSKFVLSVLKFLGILKFLRYTQNILGILKWAHLCREI